MFQYFPGNYMWSLSVLRCMAGGGIFGEIDWVCRNLHEASKAGAAGDTEAWHKAWHTLSEQVEGVARDAAGKGHSVTAREAYFRAAQYYQWTEAFLDPDDARAPIYYGKHLDCFREFAELSSPQVEILDIPFENSAITAYFVKAQNVTGRAPTVLLHDGLDGTKEEMFYVARALAARGINCLGFDGPGQGATLRVKGLVARHDSEVALSAVVDHVSGRDDVDADRIGLMAASMGGYYAPRAVCFEKRIKACVAWAAIYDYYACWQRRVGYEKGAGIQQLDANAALGTTGKHFLRIMGVQTWDQAFEKLEKFRLKGVASNITCDFLIVHGEHDRQTPLIEAQELFAEASSRHKELRVYTEAEGGAAHVQLDRPEPALSLICDWFVERL
ncbi:alpha/beta hydrolase family protein [Cupriavidus sp. CuC1]|uniref:alpha/beta hydrolase family protein n=1 Tax=Cupriavidus sp. CuC1 TaxID=3373131 RepID=UPI0037D546F0